MTWKLSFLICLAMFVAGGCTLVEKRAVAVTPSPLPAVSAETRSPLTAAVVLDKEFTSYAIRHEAISIVPGVKETLAYPIGDYLRGYAEAVSKQVFQQVSVFDSVDAAKDKADVILIPKATRSSTNITTPVQVLLVVQWEAMDRSGEATVWVTSVESEASETPIAFIHQKAVNAAYQRVFDDLTIKTLKAFSESRQMKSLQPSGQ